MHKDNGAEIEKVIPDGIASSAGIAAGDVITSINGHRVNDIIDYMFHRNDGELNIAVMRKDRRLSFKLSAAEGQDIGIEIRPFKIKVCSNKCVFCFVSQLPKGLRRTLYIKDEDYRMSFLYGNYVTLTNLSPQDKKRIVQQRLSPLYVSVHTTNKALRNEMLGNQKAADILKELVYFKEHKIKMHTQIVMCPGYNDGKELERTIRDLYKFYPYISSIAVVPVGLTGHRRHGQKMKLPDKEDALRALELIDTFQKRFRKKHGDTIVYGSDELYIKAEASFPPLAGYGDLPQLENGVGMVPLFNHQAKKMKVPVASGKKRFVTFTGTSFYPYLSKYIERVSRGGIDIEAVPVENNFFGTSVTVTGLLTGRDIVRSLSGSIRKDDILLIPDVTMREGDELFLDDVSRQDVEDVLGAKAIVIESTPKGILDAIAAVTGQ